MAVHDDDESGESLPGEVVEPPNVLAPVEKGGPPVPIDAETLIVGFRHLQRRIPGFTQLSIDEQRSMARAAYLDPEFISAGIQAAAVWQTSERYIGPSAEALRQEEEEIRRGEELERELDALVRGVRAANLKRRHHVGEQILHVYKLLGIILRHPREETKHLLPYFEEMKRLYKKSVQPKRKKPTKAE